MALLLKEMHCLSSQKIFARRKFFFAEFPRIRLGKLVLLIYLWSLHELCSKSADMVGLTRNTVGNVFAMLRYLCKRDLQIRPITPFGGCVFVVKCDESQFKHKSKVMRQQNLIFVWNCTRLSRKACFG